jgi:hypothetical protein
MTAADAHAGRANGQLAAAAAAPLPFEPLKNPPKPHFALTVGIVGHRLQFWAETADSATKPRLKATVVASVRANIDAALAAIQRTADEVYRKRRPLFHQDQQAPDLTLVSALAAGADTFAAQAALDLGYALDAPLPFPQAVYKKDLDSVAEEVDVDTQALDDQFQALLTRARVLVLPGQRRTDSDTKEQGELKESRAYEAAGLTVLSQADILLAVWDHKLPRGRGGTAEMTAEATRIGIPIILVDANGEKPTELRWRGLMPTPAPIVAFDDLPSTTLDEAGMYRVIDELVRPPRMPEQLEGLDRWYGQTSHRASIAIVFSLLMNTLGVRGIQYSDIRPKQPHELAAEYVAAASPAVDLMTPKLITNLAVPYGWADAVATDCSQFFRSAFVINFLFAAFAVVAGSASVMMGDARPCLKMVPVAIELILILCVIGNTWFGRRLNWHHRWVEAREVAERFRAALPLWTLGLRPASFPVEEPSWTGWYTRAMVRMQGLRRADLSGKNLEDERSVLLKLLKGQRDYNYSLAGRMQVMERRLEKVGLFLLRLTMIVALYHLIAVDPPGIVSQLVDRLDSVVPLHEATIWLSAALPALATASYGIRVIGDFDGIHQRDERTYLQLKKLGAAVKRDGGIPLDKEDAEDSNEVAIQPNIAIRQDPIDFALLRARARSTADALLGDVASWRLSAESRGLAIPG